MSTRYGNCKKKSKYQAVHFKKQDSDYSGQSSRPGAGGMRNLAPDDSGRVYPNMAT